MFNVFPKEGKRKKEEAALPSENEPDGYKKHKTLLGGRKGENSEENQ